MFTDDIWDQIVASTNLYADKTRAEKEARGKRPPEWEPITVPEIKAYIGLTILMGITRLPRMEDYWQESNFYLKSNLSRLFSKKRFKQIQKYLHIADPYAEAPRGRPGYGKLGKVRPLVERLKQNSKQNYKLQREISVAEVMIPYKGRLSYKQYIKAKPKMGHQTFRSGGCKEWVRLQVEVPGQFPVGSRKIPLDPDRSQFLTKILEAFRVIWNYRS